MPCTKFDDWLQADDSLVRSDLLKVQQQHLTGCPDCRDQWELVRLFRSSFQAIRVPKDMEQRVWNKVRQRLPSLPDDPAPGSGDVGGATSVAGSPGLVLGSVVGLVLLVGAAVVWKRPVPTPTPSAMSGPTTPTVQVTGQQAFLRRDVKEEPVSAAAQSWREGDLLRLSGPGAEVTLSGPGATTLRVAGYGRLRRTVQGIELLDGRMTLSGQAAPGPLPVRIPGGVVHLDRAVLRVDLQSAGGTLDLLEGRLDVEPAAGGLPAFSWAAGTRLTVRGGAITRYPVDLPVMGPSSTVGSVDPAFSGSASVGPTASTFTSPGPDAPASGTMTQTGLGDLLKQD